MQFSAIDEVPFAGEPICFRLRDCEWRASARSLRTRSLSPLRASAVEAHISEGESIHALLVSVGNQRNNASGPCRRRSQSLQSDKTSRRGRGRRYWLQRWDPITLL